MRGYGKATKVVTKPVSKPVNNAKPIASMKDGGVKYSDKVVRYPKRASYKGSIATHKSGYPVIKKK